MGAFEIAWLHWFEPGLLRQTLMAAADVYASLPSPEAQQMAADVHKVLDSAAMPRPVDVALALLWAGVFSGSVLSMVLAFIIRAAGYRPGKH